MKHATNSLMLTLALSFAALPLMAEDAAVGQRAIVRSPGSTLRVDDRIGDTISRYSYFTVQQIDGGRLLGTFTGTRVSQIRGSSAPVTAWISADDTLLISKLAAEATPRDARKHNEDTRIIVLSGDAPEDGNGRFALFDPPILNDRRQVGFGALLLHTANGEKDDLAVFVSSSGRIRQVVREFQTLTDGGQVDRLGDDGLGVIVTNLNDLGQTAFQVTQRGQMNRVAVFRGDEHGLVPVARTGDIPNRRRRFSRFATYEGFGRAINDKGQVVVWADMDRPGGDVGIFVCDNDRQKVVVQNGSVAADSRSRLMSAQYGLATTLNNLGQVAMKAPLATSQNAGSFGSHIFRGDGEELVRIAGHGQQIAAGETLTFLADPVLSPKGHVAFAGGITTASQASGFSFGIFFSRCEKNRQLVEIVRSGRALPNGDGHFKNFIVRQINAPSQIAFFAALGGVKIEPHKQSALQEYMAMVTANLPAGIPRNTSISVNGLYRTDPGSKEITRIVQTGDDSPDGNGFFAGIHNCGLALNDAGQVAFDAWLTGTDGKQKHDKAIFLFDDQMGLTLVARTESDFLGSRIVKLYDIADGEGDDRTCLNAHGQVAYGFRLADGREGIALWTPPAKVNAVRPK